MANFPRHSARFWLLVLAGASMLVACAGTHSDVKPETWRARLLGAMREDVATRDERDAHSHLLADVVDAGALDRMERPDVEAAFGKGLACETYPLCQEQGFLGTDAYYLIGNAVDPKIKQLPVLIVGYDTHDIVKRVYSLTTH